MTDYTLQIAALTAAIAAGVTSASYDGKSVSYRSLSEMRQILAWLTAQQAGSKQTRQLRLVTRKAY